MRNNCLFVHHFQLSKIYFYFFLLQLPACFSAIRHVDRAAIACQSNASSSIIPPLIYRLIHLCLKLIEGEDR